jgi:hypothetical protein
MGLTAAQAKGRIKNIALNIIIGLCLKIEK